MRIRLFQILDNIHNSANATSWNPAEAHDQRSIINLHLIEDSEDLLFSLQIELIQREEIHLANKAILFSVAVYFNLLNVKEVLAEPLASDLE